MSQPSEAEATFAQFLGQAREKLGDAAFSKIELTQFSNRRGTRYAKTQRLADALLEIVNEKFADIPLSTRQVFYQGVVCGACPNTATDYGRVQRLLVELRREGEVE